MISSFLPFEDLLSSQVGAHFIPYRSIDTMKISRDSNSTSNADKILHANALASTFPSATHFTMDGFYETPTYQSTAYIQEWCDALHNTGKSIWFRGVPDWTGLTAAQSITHVAALIAAHPTWFQNGDIFEFYAESNPYIFSNPPDNWNNSTVLWSQWLADMIAACNTAFAGIGKSGVITTIQSIVSSYYTQGDVKSTAITAMNNQICIDYYPLDDASLSPTIGVKNMMTTLSALHTSYPTANIIISEIGATNTISSTDDQQQSLLQAACNKLSTLSYIAGVNYWVGYGGVGRGGATYIFQDSSLNTVRPAANTLAAFYKKNSNT